MTLLETGVTENKILPEHEPEESPFNILVLNSDKSTGLNFVKSLQLAKRNQGRKYFIVGASTDLIRAQLCANDITVLIDREMISPVDIKGYAEDAVQKAIDLVYETKSAEYMLRIDACRDLIPVFIPSSKSIRIFEDKFRTFSLLREGGFPVPDTILPRNRREIRDFMAENQYHEVWVRSLMGQGGKRAFTASDSQSVADVIERGKDWGNYTVAERLPKQDISTGWEPHLTDELLPGEMVTWMALYDNGSFIASQVRKRLYWEHGDLSQTGVTGYSGANMTIKRDDIHDLSDSIVRFIDKKPHGAMGADFVVDKDGKAKLTEIQASRFYTSTYPIALLGLNFPDLYVNCFRRIKLQEGLVNPCEPGMIYIQRFGADSVMVHRSNLRRKIS